MNSDGILVVDKTAGMTSHDVVGRVRRLLKTKRVGHAGTLDPDATGVLVVAVGQATRLLPYLPLEPKKYIARALFGFATDTEDASGNETSRGDASGLTLETLEASLAAFQGEIQQIPPMVSALHHEGQRLYDLARQGITVDRPARPVTIHTLTIEDFSAGEIAEATLSVVCGSGTYIRTLCADIGLAVGLPAHMKSLVREAVGNFRRADAHSLLDLESEGSAAKYLLSIEESLDLPHVSISDSEADEIGFGRSIPAHADSYPELSTVALVHEERLRALARYENYTYKPFRVLSL